MSKPAGVGRTQTRPDKRDAIAHAEQVGAYSELVDYARALYQRAKPDTWLWREARRAEMAAERLWMRGAA